MKKLLILFSLLSLPALADEYQVGKVVSPDGGVRNNGNTAATFALTPGNRYFVQCNAAVYAVTGTLSTTTATTSNKQYAQYQMWDIDFTDARYLSILPVTPGVVTCTVDRVTGVKTGQSLRISALSSGSSSSSSFGPDGGLNALTVNVLTVNQDAGVLGSLWVSGDAGVRGQLLVMADAGFRSYAMFNGDAGVTISNSGVANKTVLRLEANTDKIEMGTLGASIWGDSSGNVNFGGGTLLDNGGITGRSTNKLVLTDDDGVSVNGTTFLFNNTNRALYINDSEGMAMVGVATGSLATCNNNTPDNNLGTRGAWQYDTTTSTYKYCDGTSYGEVAGTRGKSSGTIDFGSVSAGACVSNTQTLTGAAANDPVACGYPTALEDGLIPSCWVSAADTIKYRLCNVTGSPIDPASGNFSARATK